MPAKIVIIFHRLDLRLHDQALYHAAHSPEDAEVTHVLPLFVFDERHIELSGLPGYKAAGPPAKTRLCGFWRTGVFRARFLTESVYDLQARLKERGSTLLIRYGKPEQVIVDLIQGFQARGDVVKAVYATKEICREEVDCETALSNLLEPLQVPVKLFKQKTLVHHEDLPFTTESIPDVFTPFRKKIEGLGKDMHRALFPEPQTYKPFPQLPVETKNFGVSLDNTSMEQMQEYFRKPLLESVQSQFDQHSKKSAFPFPGGETAALDRLDWYFVKGGDPPPAAKYKQTRNHLLGHAYSTKMSPFLCFGSVSPRKIMQKLTEHEQKYGGSTNTYWIQFELLWRDYFMFVSEKYGNQLFKLGGFEEITDPKAAVPKLDKWNKWDPSDPKIERWMSGRTGVPFVDANMVELVQSGFMSNRGRQNVASFLTKDLYYDWRIGAEYFESHLVDYEPCANYGNWQYVSGVGNDPRASRQFNPIKQGKDYDIHGAYIKHWLPQLGKIPASKVHVPWTLSDEEAEQYGLGSVDYPREPLVEQESWKAHYQRKDHERTKLKGNNAERVKDADEGSTFRRSAPVTNRQLPAVSSEVNGPKKSVTPSYKRTGPENGSWRKPA